MQQIKRDMKKLDFCNLNGIKLMEIYPTDTVNEELFNKFDIFL